MDSNKSKSEFSLTVSQKTTNNKDSNASELNITQNNNEIQIDSTKSKNGKVIKKFQSTISEEDVKKILKRMIEKYHNQFDDTISEKLIQLNGKSKYLMQDGELIKSIHH